MNTNYAISRITSKGKGQFFKMSYISDLPMTAAAKREGLIALKSTTGTFRWGINYSHIKSVKEKDEAIKTLGVAPKHELPWGQWNPQYPQLVINHKDKQYMRLYMTPNKSKSNYYLNGRPITKEELIELGVVQKSYWNKGDTKQECMTINIANIQEIY